MSLDFGLLTKLMLTATEKFSSKDTNTNDYSSVVTVITILIGMILGVTAFILSWLCNTAMGYTIFKKTFYGIFSFAFGLTYIMLYLILRWDTCYYIIKKNKRV